MSIDRNIQNRLFDIAWILFIATQLITLTAWYAQTESALKVLAYKASLGMTCALFIIVIIINLIQKKYPLKTFLCYGLFAAVSAASWYFCRTTLLLVMAALFMAAYELSAKRVIAISTVVTGVILATTVLLSEIGLAENILFDADFTRLRYSLGFLWVSNGPTLLFFFTLQYIFLRKEKMKIWEYVILEAINVYMFLRTNTNVPFIMTTLLIVFFAIQGLFKNHWRILSNLKILYYIVPTLICAVTIFLYFMPDLNSAVLTGLWNRINVVLHNRMLYGRMGILEYGIRLFGQQIEWIGVTLPSDGASGLYNYVDCSYIRILLNNGIVYLLAILGVYTRMIIRAVREADFWLVFIAIFVLLHSFTEPRLMEMSFNVIPVLAFLRLGEEPVEYTRESLKNVFMGVTG